MAGAAIAPALDVIQAHFAGMNPLWVQMLVSMPALFIILTTFVFPYLTRRFSTRALVLWALVVYIVSGSAAFFVQNIWLILLLRALLGCSVGVLMPLSTGLLYRYFSPKHHARLMGISSSMNYLGAVVATLLTGLLSHIQWNYSFLVYLGGLVALIPCFLFLPKESTARQQALAQQAQAAPGLSQQAKSPAGVYLIVLMFLSMGTFFIYPTNYALLCAQDGYRVPAPLITVMMATMDVIAMLMSMFFADIMGWLKRGIRFAAPVMFLAGYAVLWLCPQMETSIAGSVLVGIGSGLAIPLVFASAGRMYGAEAAQRLMPRLSASLYAAQFLVPFIVSFISPALGTTARKPYVVALIMAVALLAVSAQLKDRESERE